jgi:plastocyanin
MSNKFVIAGVSGTAAVVAAAFAVQAWAGPEKIAYPRDFATWERYGVVDRYDTKQHRELYAKPEVVRAVREGKPVPDGAVIVMAISNAKLDAAGNPVKNASGRFEKGTPAAHMVMEKRKGWGAEYPATKRNGEWEYAAFLPDGSPNAKANAGIDACFACHLPHGKQDYVISLASLGGKFPTGAASGKGLPNEVTIRNFQFGTGSLSVPAGTVVNWTNVDDSPHQVTISHSDQRSEVLLKGQSTAFTFATAGIYNYICGLHPGMKGTVEVK